MVIARYIVAFAAALAMLTPGVCMCGCPCEMLLGGEAKPADAAQPSAPSCCRHAAPASGPAASAPHDCCCDAQRPQVAEASPASASAVDAGSPAFAAIALAPDSINLEVEARTGPDPPDAALVDRSTSLRDVLRN